jgi:tetratricopeptide (TPR) repeat protein
LSTSLSEFKPILPQASLLTSADRERVAEITATVGAAHQHGCIYFGICNNRLKIGAIEEALEKSLAAKGITISRVLLAERYESDAGPQYRVQIPDPVTYLSEQAQRERTLFFIHGLPELIRAQTDGDYSKVAPVSQLLNYRRELFHDRAICAFFWLNPETVPYLRQNARDFWAFRSGTANFLEVEAQTSRVSGILRQEREATTRWSGDLEEKLGQLVAYRRKSPPDNNAIGNLLLDIGRLHTQRHESERALERLHEALAIFETLALEDKVRDSKLWLARAFKDAGRLDDAEACLLETIEIDERLENQLSLATEYNNLSQIYDARGQLEEAEKWLRKAIEIDERLGNEPGLAIRYNNLSQICHSRGRLEEAERWLRRAVGIDEHLVDEPNLAIDYNNLSQIYSARGQLGEAEEWLRKAIEVIERLQDEPLLATLYNNLSQIYYSQGQLEEAEKRLRKAIEIDERLGDEPSLAVCYNNLSQVYDARGQLEEAEEWLRKAIEIDERLGNQPSLATDYNNLGQIYGARGQLEEAEKWLRKAIEIDERRGNEAKLGLRYGNLSQIYQAQGQLEEAEKWLRKAIEIDERRGTKRSLDSVTAT